MDTPYTGTVVVGTRHKSQYTLLAYPQPAAPRKSQCARWNKSNHIEPAACTKRACEVCNFPIDDADKPLHLGCPLLILCV
jgi:hypothetical protein